MWLYNYTVIIIFTYVGPPALTVNITKHTESSSIVVQWDEVDDSLTTTYVITWTSERDLNNVQAKTVEEHSSYNITGLTLNTVYTITVYATNRCGQGPEHSTSVSLTTDAIFSSTSTAITNTMTITSTASLSTSTAIMKSSTITASNAVINPITITITETINLMTSSTNPSAVITSANTPTDNMSPASTMNLIDTTTTDDNSKILSTYN